jgi:hypothetical protein
MNVSVYPTFVTHLVEQTPLLRAGATLVQTQTGEDLQIPKTTAYQTGNVIGLYATKRG